MLRFLKENGDMIVRCLVTQIALAVFGLMLSMATTNAASGFLALVTGMFSVIFYLYLLWDAMWREGSSDKIRIDGGRMQRMPLKGLYVSLLANVPNLLLALLIWIGYFIPAAPGNNASQLSASCQMIAVLFEGMYSGVIAYVNNGTSNASAFTALLYTLICLPAPIACSLAYWRGSWDKTFLPQQKK